MEKLLFTNLAVNRDVLKKPLHEIKSATLLFVKQVLGFAEIYIYVKRTAHAVLSIEKNKSQQKSFLSQTS